MTKGACAVASHESLRFVGSSGCSEQGAPVPDIPETHHDLLNAPFATLATVGTGGRPQLSTIYFLASADGTVQLSVNATRQKLKNMVANPKVALHIQDTVQYVRYLEFRGDAMVEPGHDHGFAHRLC